jgi:Kef-type K+ transport system membrane component KefB
MAAMDAIYQQLTILLALATLSHFTIKRFRQPTIVGEALAIVAEERPKAQALVSTDGP